MIILTPEMISEGVMRTYYFFMKFMRSFLIGLGCGFGAIAVLACVAVMIYAAVTG